MKVTEKEIKKNWVHSAFSDKDWDFDLTKFVGAVVVLSGLIGFFMNKDTNVIMSMLGFGSGLLGIAKAKGD